MMFRVRLVRFVTTVVTTIVGCSYVVALLSSAHAAFPADEVYGQYQDDATTKIFTQGAAHSRPVPNGIGIDTGGIDRSSIVTDTQRDRIYVADSGNKRILVWDVVDTSATLDPTAPADYVLGQPDLSTGDTASGVNSTELGAEIAGLAIDKSNGRLFVSDSDRNRVLIFDVSGSISNEMAATAVLGQSDLSSSGTGTTATTLDTPHDLAYDGNNDRLYVADTDNRRVIVYDVASISNGEAAVNVLGEEDFTTVSNAFDQDSITEPQGIAYDPTGDRLFVTDNVGGFGPNRVLVFDVAAITNGENAINVLGQSNFTDSGTGTTSSSFDTPSDLTIDTAADLLYVLDEQLNGGALNNRVMVFDISSITDGEAAVNVLGQPDFTTSGEYLPTRSRFEEAETVALLADSKVMVRDNARTLIFDTASITNGEDAVNVFHQVSFEGNISYFTNRTNAQLPTAKTFESPMAIAIDTTDKYLYIADQMQDGGVVKVFALNDDLSLADEAADFVIGAPYLDREVTSIIGSSTPSQDRFNTIGDIVIDEANDYLFVLDDSFNRILVFDTDNLADGMDATAVIGQTDFTSETSGTTASTLDYPTSLGFDPTNQWLFVGDYSNQRILTFDISDGVATGEAAFQVFGANDFTTVPSCGSPTQNEPCGVYGGMGFEVEDRKLFVPDDYFDRVLVYDIPENKADHENNPNATNVLGVEDFTTDGYDAGPTRDNFDYAGCGVVAGTANDLYVFECSSGRVMVFDITSIENGEDATAVLGQDDFTSVTGGVTQETFSTNSENGDIPLLLPSTKEFYLPDAGNARVLRYQLPRIDDATYTANVGMSTTGTVPAAGVDGTSSITNTSGTQPSGITFSSLSFAGTPTTAGTFVGGYQLADEYGGFGTFLDTATLTFDISAASDTGSEREGDSAGNTSGDAVSQCTEEPPTDAPAVFVANRSDRRITLSISPVKEAEEYAIYYSNTTMERFEHATIVDAGDDSGVKQVQIDAVPLGLDFYFQVQALRECAAGPLGTMYEVAARTDTVVERQGQFQNAPRTVSVTDTAQNDSSNTEREGDTVTQREGKAAVDQTERSPRADDTPSLLGRLLSPLRRLIETVFSLF